MLKTLVNEIASVAGYLWDKGWAEKNAGNLSVDVTDIVDFNEQGIFSCGAYSVYPGLAGKVILITASGSKMRDIKVSPLNHIVFLRFDSAGKNFSKYKLNSKFRFYVSEDIPSSELTVHLEIHESLIKVNRPAKAVLHTHSTELISFSHTAECTNERRMNRKLAGMHPEFSLFLPEGIGLVKEQASGTAGIAAETAGLLKTHNVVLWKKHGVIAAAGCLTDAFDLIDVASKSASIYLLSVRAKR